MDLLTEIVNVVGSLGFPIFMCIYMINYNNSVVENLRKTVEENTLTVQRLIDLVGGKLDEHEKGN